MPNVTLPAPASNVGYLVRSLDKGKAPSRVGTRNKEFLLVDTELVKIRLMCRAFFSVALSGFLKLS